MSVFIKILGGFSTVILALAHAGAGSVSMFETYEPPVPEKLARN